MKKLYIMLIVISSQLVIAQKDSSSSRRGNTMRRFLAALCIDLAESHQNVTRAEAQIWQSFKSNVASISH